MENVGLCNLRPWSVGIFPLALVQLYHEKSGNPGREKEEIMCFFFCIRNSSLK
jgi:hypothetical protein